VGLIPKGITLDHWFFLSDGNIRVPGTTTQFYPNLYLVGFNTFLLAVLIAFLEVIFSSLAGYALSRYKFKGRENILTLTLILHAFPGITLLIALFYVLNALGLYNTLIGVIIVKVALDMPLGIWIMKGFFDGIPWDIEMSALVDGCSRLQAWWKVIMPNVRNGIMAVIIFGFLSGWGEFIYVLTFIASQKYWTFSMLVYALTTGEYSYINPGVTATVAIIYMIPVVIFFLFAQQYLLRIQIAGKSTA
jgi:inositol-phosphate transport system permease protein